MMIIYEVKEQDRRFVNQFLIDNLHTDLSHIESGGNEATSVVCQLVLNYQARLS